MVLGAAMQPKTSIPVVRRVRFKDGRTLDVFHNHAPDRSDVARTIGRVMDVHFGSSGFLGGFAFVVWNTDGASTAKLACYNGMLTRVLAPDFVRDRLMLQTAEDWSRE